MFSAGTFVCAYNVGAASKYIPTKANAGSDARAIVLDLRLKVSHESL
jgi:hypothetical protein